MARFRHAPASHAAGVAQAPCGSVRTCMPYAGELARHRVITADGHDYVVATTRAQGDGEGYVTGAYPVTRGYLVMVRQPLCELRDAEGPAAHERHEQLVRVLAEAGVKLVRARRALAARHHSERIELLDVRVVRPAAPEGALPAFA